METFKSQRSLILECLKKQLKMIPNSELQGREKTDLNDILLELGVEGLEDVLQSSLRRVELR